MSIATEITRLNTARNTIRDTLVGFGLAQIGDKLDVLATKVAGIDNKGAVDVEVKEGESYAIPAGYHNGSGTVKGVAGGGNYNLQAKSITPTTSQQAVTPDQGYYGLSGVTVGAIPSNYKDVSSTTAEAANVLANKIFVDADGVTTTGTMANNGAVSKTLSATATSYTVPAGYHNGSGVVNIVTETKTATPTKSSQTISATSGKVMSAVTVNAIPSIYGDATNADVTDSKLLEGVTAITNANGVATEITGTMTNNAGVVQQLTPTVKSYAIPEGYHDGTGSVYISVSVQTATPTKSQQVITPSTTGAVLSQVTVEAIPAKYQDVSGVTASAADVLDGKYFVDDEGTLTEGTMVNRGTVTQTLSTSTTSYTIPAGKHSGSGKVSITTEEKSATPSTSAQNITPTTGKVLSKVTVAAIPAIYGDATDADAVAANLLSGKVAISKSNGAAVEIEGTMTNNGTLSQTIDGMTTTSYTLSAGYYAGGTVSLDSTIETALAAI